MQKSEIGLIITTLIVICILFGILYLDRTLQKGKGIREIDNAIRFFKLHDTLQYDKQSLPLNQAMQDVFAEHPEIASEAKGYWSANFVLWETLNIIDTLMPKVTYPDNVKFMYGVAGTDRLASKSNLAFSLRSTLPDKDYQDMVPKTFILSIKDDYEKLQKDMTNRVNIQKNVYILKKNIQRQEGHFITNNWDDALKAIEENKKEPFVVAQELLQNPLIVGGRKVNMRIYLLVHVGANGTVRFHIYYNGFMYYTPQFFKPYGIDKDQIITTGYIDRKVYEENPLSLMDLRKHLGNEQYDKMFENIKVLFKKLKTAYDFQLRIDNKDIPGDKFLIYGCDIAPDENLNVKLIEINKGPDLSYKDARDKAVKFNMVRDAFRTVGLLPWSGITGFIQV